MYLSRESLRVRAVSIAEKWCKLRWYNLATFQERSLSPLCMFLDSPPLYHGTLRPAWRPWWHTGVTSAKGGGAVLAPCSCSSARTVRRHTARIFRQADLLSEKAAVSVFRDPGLGLSCVLRFE